MEYGPDLDTALETLVCEFFIRLEELLPVPDFKQVWRHSITGCQEEKVLVCLTQALCVWQLVTFQNKFVLNELLSNIRVMFRTRVGKRDWRTGRLSHYQ